MTPQAVLEAPSPGYHRQYSWHLISLDCSRCYLCTLTEPFVCWFAPLTYLKWMSPLCVWYLAFLQPKLRPSLLDTFSFRRQYEKGQELQKVSKLCHQLKVTLVLNLGKSCLGSAPGPLLIICASVSLPGKQK